MVVSKPMVIIGSIPSQNTQLQRSSDGPSNLILDKHTTLTLNKQLSGCLKLTSLPKYQNHQRQMPLKTIMPTPLSLLSPCVLASLFTNSLYVYTYLKDNIQLTFCYCLSMSFHHQPKFPSLSKPYPSSKKEFIEWIQSLSIEQKCRVTRVHSTQLVTTLSLWLAGASRADDNTGKHPNHKKQKSRGQSVKGHDDHHDQCLFDSLMVFSEVDFLDSVGLDFNLIKDYSRMFDILSTLSAKNQEFSPELLRDPKQIRSRNDIGILISAKILKQISEVRTSQKFPPDCSAKRRDVGNYWARLDPAEKSELLLFENQTVLQLAKSLQKKGIDLTIAALEKEVTELLKLQKNQFCNRLLKCRLKKLGDPIKMYHHKLFRTMTQKTKSKNKKKAHRRQEIVQKQIFEEKQKESDMQRDERRNNRCKIISSDSITEKESSQDQVDQRVKSFSVSSNDTNQTESYLDFRLLGDDYYSKRIQTLYHHKIATDLQEYGDIIGQKANSYQKYRLVAFNRIQCVLGVDVQLILFGSCANGLMIEKSDVDIVVSHHVLSFFPYGSLKDRVVYILTHFHALLQQPWVTKCSLITTASIPVLKLEIDTSTKVANPQNFLDKENMFEGYPDGVKIQVDITVDTSPFQGESQHLGLQATQAMNKWMSQIPNLYSIAILLKCLFQKKDLNSTYKGGLGSYCTMVMILAYLKLEKKQFDDICTQTEGLLNFYSLQFNQQTTGVDIRDDVFTYAKQTPDHKLQVRDPLNGKVMSRNAYLFPKIKQQFMLLKKECFSNLKGQIQEHLGLIEEKEERDFVLGLSPKEYFKMFSSKYSKNVFCQYDFT